MRQTILHVALVVRDYDEAIDFYCHKLHFNLVEDTYQPEQDKRWVVVAPPGSAGSTLLLARASTPQQAAFIGNQTGGRVFLFLATDDFWRDYREMQSAGIRFVREPKEAGYGTVAVFEDLYGNHWDLIQPSTPDPAPAATVYRPNPRSEFRVKLDFRVDFTNGGYVEGRDFLLDIEGTDVSDQVLEGMIVEAMNLARAGRVLIQRREIVPRGMHDDG